MNRRNVFRFFSVGISLIFAVNSLALQQTTPVLAAPATWLVNSVDDSNDGSCSAPDCTLREAITLSSGGDTINFEATIAGSTINLASTLIIDHHLIIDNSNHKNRVILNGQGLDNIMDVSYGVSLTVKKVSFVSGLSSGGGINSDHGNVTISYCNFTSNGSVNAAGGALRNYLGTMDITYANFSSNSGNNGGAIYNYGHLSISDSTFEDNTARSYGGAIYNSLGSISDMSLLIANSTFSGNATTDYDGGAIYNDSYGPLEITNSTFEGNTAANRGGGIFSDSSTNSLITHSTFSGNSAVSTLHGGGIHIFGSLRMYNSIIANTSSGYDCYWNYIDNPWSTTNLIENNAPLPNSCGTPLSTADPMLQPLAQNGGFTHTMALPLASPAVDQGNPTWCVTEDQRGVTRPQGPACDLGSFEYLYPDTTPPVVSSITTADPNPTDATIVNYTVTFSETVTGVDITDFNLRDTGLSGTSLGAVVGSGSVYTVSANTGSGIGTLRLDVLDDGTIFDLAILQLGGPGNTNGNFTSGELYMVRYLATFLPLVMRE